jgi:hypothetical protein
MIDFVPTASGIGIAEIQRFRFSIVKLAPIRFRILQEL